MFIGHYGPAFVAKKAAPVVPLAVLFVAVQWVDVWWSILVMAGVEKVHIIPHFLGLSPLDLYYMPYTHGLPGSILLSLLIGGFVALFARSQRLLIVSVVAAASFSHWLLDVIVHRPDLPLFDDQMKVGFGLWQYPYVSVPLEIALMLGGLWLYDRAQPSPRRSGTIALWLFGAAMAALQIQNTFLADPPSTPSGFARLALVGYGVLALLAAVVDYLRRPLARPK